MSVRGVVLAYHGVGSPAAGTDLNALFVAPDRFAAQMRHLASKRRVVPLLDVVRGTAPAGSVALTFDDGYRSLLRSAVPVLQEHGFPSTVFVPTAYLGGRNEWDEPTGLDLSIMSAQDLRDAQRQGMRVETHGHAHIDCRTATVQQVEADLAVSVSGIEQAVGHRPTLLAWPFRDGSAQAQAVARRLGFEAAFSIDQPHAGRWSWERVQVTPRDSAALFALKTSGSYMRLRHARVLDVPYRLAKRVVGARA